MSIPVTGLSRGWMRCTLCGKLLKPLPGESDSYCPRCHTKNHFRLSASVSRSWAYTVVGWLCLVPANYFPVMTVIYFGRGAPDTIISGVAHLWSAGMWGIAALVFVASVAVPVLKLVGLSILLMTVQFKWMLDRRQCAMLFRAIHFIGRWSLLDLFMISILVTLVDLGAVATIEAGPGSTAFATVVVTTILAANSFDARLIWDLEKEPS
ncbi:paraquat-inducible protein A [Porticoccus sp.]